MTPPPPPPPVPVQQCHLHSNEDDKATIRQWCQHNDEDDANTSTPAQWRQWRHHAHGNCHGKTTMMTMTGGWWWCCCPQLVHASTMKPMKTTAHPHQTTYTTMLYTTQPQPSQPCSLPPHLGPLTTSIDIVTTTTMLHMTMTTMTPMPTWQRWQWHLHLHSCLLLHNNGDDYDDDAINHNNSDGDPPLPAPAPTLHWKWWLHFASPAPASARQWWWWCHLHLHLHNNKGDDYDNTSMTKATTMLCPWQMPQQDSDDGGDGRTIWQQQWQDVTPAGQRWGWWM